jgi:LacI family transcriptional regulator
MRNWLAEGEVPDAIFVVNDPAAIGAMRALDEAGLQAGKDVALVGAGNIHYGAMLRVPLTTVSWSKSEMGRSVARLLIELIEDKSPATQAQHVVLEPELLVRDSCGARASKPTLRVASK